MIVTILILHSIAIGWLFVIAFVKGVKSEWRDDTENFY